jgi:hypothetical protein
MPVSRYMHSMKLATRIPMSVLRSLSAGIRRKLNSANPSASRADHWNPREFLTRRELASTRFRAALAW